VSSVITIGFSGRTRACLQTEFTPPIADDERRETLIHVALLTARTFAALEPEVQLTFAATLREWIEDKFIACPTRLIPGDPMACLPRFASTFVAPVREYALASKGCNHNGRGVEFFLPMALVSFLHHVVLTHANPEDLLKPAMALCGAVVIQPMTMENHFQAAAASLPKVASILEKAVEAERVVTQTVLPRPSVERKPAPKPIPARAEPAMPGIPGIPRRRERRRTLVISACIAALLIMAGVQYLSVHEPLTFSPGRDIASAPPPASVPVPTPTTPLPAPTPSPEPEPPKLSGPILTSPTADQAPAPPASEPTAPSVTVEPAPIPSIIPEPPVPVAEPPLPAADKSSSQAIRAYQQKVRELAEDAMAQVVVVINAIEGQVLTEFALKDVLEYGLQQTRADLRRLQRLTPPDTYQSKQQDVIQVVADLERLAKALSMLRMQPPAGMLQERLSNIEGRLEEALHAVDNM
jgi:hypothetical protein